MFTNLKNRWYILVIGLVLGCVGGFIYYYFVGCNSGTCPIKSNPFASTAYGGVIGLLFGLLFIPTKKSNKDNNKDLRDKL